jgi:hypothetical protein
MKFIFLTAIRVAPEHWITWRQAITTLFARGGDESGFTCHTGPRPEMLINITSLTGAATQTMGQVLATPRAQDLYHKPLPPVGDHPDDTAHLVVLKSGEVCRVDVVLMETATATDQHAQIMEKIAASLTGAATLLTPFVPRGMTTAQLIHAAEFAIHTLMPFDKDDAAQHQTVASFFAREGLHLDAQNGKPEPFFPGWSFSALECTNPNEIGLFSAVVMRLQCVWFQQRGQRDFCIAQTGLLARRETVETDITNSHEVIRRLFDFTLWEHELREFSANLKPWLKTAFDQLYTFWDMAEESAYVEKTLKQSHELLASGYQSRILIQERQQSRLLFVIASVGLLSIAGSLMSIWTALTWGGIVTQGYWTSDIGSTVLIGLIAANFVALGIVLYRFVTTQIK